MKKIPLTDVTFLILVRLDSIERLENVKAVTDHLLRYFDTRVTVREAAGRNTGLLRAVLDRRVDYRFVEDTDPILYKTRHFNEMARAVDTPFLAIWDADVLAYPGAVAEGVLRLREGKADVALPYGGTCLDVPEILRSFYFRRRDLRMLERHRNKMDKLYEHVLVGGAVIVDREKYAGAGMENEGYYGWGDDDFDRFIRFLNRRYRIYRSPDRLYHLWHPRSRNSFFHSPFHGRISKRELHRTKSE